MAESMEDRPHAFLNAMLIAGRRQIDKAKRGLQILVPKGGDVSAKNCSSEDLKDNDRQGWISNVES